MASRNRQLSLRGLRTFCVAAEYESFRDAADRLFITASAVSHQIKNLEEELGQKLFERQSRAVRLTGAGQSLFDDVRPIIASLDEITARHMRDEPRCQLNISVQPFFASEAFVPRLPEFKSANPEFDIKVETSDESAERHPGTADVSIRVFRAPPTNLASDRLFSLRLIPAASAEFCDRLEVTGGRIVSDFPLIVHESRPTAWRQWEKSSGIVLPKQATTVRLDSMIAVVRAAERGLGAALVPALLCDAWFESGNLVRLFDQELITSDAYYVVSNPAEAEQPAVQRFRQWVLEEFVEPS